MCGIVGFLGAPQEREDARRWLSERRDRMQHRGPDDEGLWVNEDGSAGLGHRRLSILDLSPEGHQPMASADGRYEMVFNGEIYNFLDLKGELEQKGHSFRGGSDTEVMLAAFCEWGVTVSVKRFRGMFAFALWDRHTACLILGRDHYGKKPLYYGVVGDRWVFASELKALHQPGLEIDRQALAEYFRFAYVPAPRSIYREFKKLPPASLVELRPDLSQGAVESFWSLREVASGGSGRVLGNPLEATETVLRESVRRRMISDVPLGAFLSGGVDSTLIVCLMQQLSSQPVQTFCIGFAEESHDESPFAREVSRHLGTQHLEHRLSAAEAMSVVPLLPQLYDEPFADSSQIPTYLVSKLARTQVTVALSGDGGDEVFGGYNRYLWAPKLWRALRLVPLPLRKLVAVLLNRFSAASTAGWLGKVRYPHEKLAKVLEALRVSSSADLYASLVSQWKESPVLGAAPQWAAATAGRDFLFDMMVADATSYLPDDILVKVDRASMGVSLECRAPFLDPDVAEVAWSLPADAKIQGTTGKWILRRLIEKYLPAQLMARPKTGFSLPLGEWLRGPLRGYAEDLLQAGPMRSQGYLNVDKVQACWTEHLSGHRDRSAQLWCVLMFQAWLQEWDG